MPHHDPNFTKNPEPGETNTLPDTLGNTLIGFTGILAQIVVLLSIYGSVRYDREQEFLEFFSLQASYPADVQGALLLGGIAGAVAGILMGAPAVIVGRGRGREFRLEILGTLMGGCLAGFLYFLWRATQGAFNIQFLANIILGAVTGLTMGLFAYLIRDWILGIFSKKMSEWVFIPVVLAGAATGALVTAGALQFVADMTLLR